MRLVTILRTYLYIRLTTVGLHWSDFPLLPHSGNTFGTSNRVGTYLCMGVCTVVNEIDIYIYVPNPISLLSHDLRLFFLDSLPGDQTETQRLESTPDVHSAG